MNKITFVKLQKIAEEAAKKAGSYIHSHKENNIETEFKKNQKSLASQVVTEIDRNSQKIILDELYPTIIKYNLGVLTEESNDDGSRFMKDFFWAIDPLDGTLSYINQTDGYSVSIALISKCGDVIIGVVYNPVNDLLYSSIKGSGVFCNGLILTKRNRNFSFSYDSSFNESKYFQNSIAVINDYALSKKISKIITIAKSGAVINAVSIIESGAGCYFKFPKSTIGGGAIWDFAATSLFFSEMGYIVTNFYNKEINFNSENLFMNSNGIIFSTDIDLHNIILDLL